MNKLEAFELWYYSPMLKLSVIRHTSNEAIRKMIKRERELLNSIIRRKVKYLFVATHYRRKNQGEDKNRAQAIVMAAEH